MRSLRGAPPAMAPISQPGLRKNINGEGPTRADLECPTPARPVVGSRGWNCGLSRVSALRRAAR